MIVAGPAGHVKDRGRRPPPTFEEVTQLVEGLRRRILKRMQRLRVLPEADQDDPGQTDPGSEQEDARQDWPAPV